MSRYSDDLNHYYIQPPRLITRNHDTPRHELREELRVESTGINKPLELLTVTIRSPLSHRRAVWRLARYFRREFRFDFEQYGYEGRDDDFDHRAYLWLADRYSHASVIGACCFRWRDEYKDLSPRWGLQWIWFHPYERRKGHLTEAWPYFRARFGDFCPEPPLSAAMRSFLFKMEDARLVPGLKAPRTRQLVDS